MLLAARTRPNVPMAIRTVQQHAKVSSGAFVVYKFQKAQSPLDWWLGESPLPQTLMRAIDPKWLSASMRESPSDDMRTSVVETRETIGTASFFPRGNRISLQIPTCVHPGERGEYGKAKLVPGALVSFKCKPIADAEVMYLNGIVRSVSSFCTIRPIALHDYQPGRPATEQRALAMREGPLQALGGGDLEVNAEHINTGSPQEGVHRSISPAVSALRAHPAPAQKAEVLIDGEAASHSDPDFWNRFFTRRNSELGARATAMDLVRSRADIRLDDEIIPILLNARQGDGRAW